MCSIFNSDFILQMFVSDADEKQNFNFSSQSGYSYLPTSLESDVSTSQPILVSINGQVTSQVEFDSSMQVSEALGG